MIAIKTADCSVELVSRGRKRRHTCSATRAVHYEATCGCGHDMAGWACQACLMARKLGCLTCWESSQRHVCPVTFTEDGVS